MTKEELFVKKLDDIKAELRYALMMISDETDADRLRGRILKLTETLLRDAEALKVIDDFLRMYELFY